MLSRLVTVLLFVLLSLLLTSCQPINSSGPQPSDFLTATRIEMVYLPGGTFQMGSNRGEADEGPRHEVLLSPFAIDKYEVTHEMFAAAELPNPSKWQDDPRKPVERVRWRDAKQYCNERSLMEDLEPCYDESRPGWPCDFSASGYRLPTEAEWEYACRASTSGNYDFGTASKLGQYAVFADSGNQRTHPVGTKKPNRWDIHDMYGNVSEWCQDVYDENYYEQSPVEDPQGPNAPSRDVKRVMRGGSWKATASMCRATFRQGQRTGDTDSCFFTDYCGFRCVRRVQPSELTTFGKETPSS